MALSLPLGSESRLCPLELCDFGSYSASLGLIFFPCEMRLCTCPRGVGRITGEEQKTGPLRCSFALDVGTVLSEERGCEM